MSENPWVNVVSTGVVTPIGDNALKTSVAISAGICMFEETGFLTKRYQPIKMATVPDGALPSLNKKLPAKYLPDRQLRMLRLAASALRQLDDDLPKDNPLTLFLALPELLPGKSKAIKGNFVEQLAEQSGISLNSADS